MLKLRLSRKRYAILGLFAMVTSCAAVIDRLGDAQPSGNNDYWTKVQTSGPIETKYMRLGPNDVSTYAEPAPTSLQKYRVWYPADVGRSSRKYPVIVSNNGTGWGAAKYEQWFRHMASWGFIVVGNEEGTSWNGKSAELTLAWLLKADNTPSSIFFKHIDRSHIGVIGHSQGGTGAINAATVQPSASMYKTIVVLASTSDGYNAFTRWTSHASKIAATTLILVSKDDWLTSHESLNKIFDAIPDGKLKAQARRLNSSHGEMLFAADGYVTAWMMWQLQDDIVASKAFVGAKGELRVNPQFSDVKIAGSRDR